MKSRLNILIASLICLTMTVPQAATATQLFIKKSKPSAEAPAAPPQPAIPELEDKTSEEKSDDEIRPEATIEDFAGRYYQNCMAQDHPLLQGENLELLCGCTAAQLSKVMTVEQVRQMQEDTADGQYQRNRMMMFVYAPCIEHPTRALVLDQCMNDPKVRGAMKNFKTVCNCLADGMAAFMKERAPGVIESAIKYNEKDIDPLRRLLESKAFDDMSQAKMRECIALYELGQSRF